MQPQPQPDSSNGILQVVAAYYKYLPSYGVTFTPNERGADLIVGHAGSIPNPHVAMLHGLNWTSDYKLGDTAYQENEAVINSARHAKVLTVPSEWVAETFRRDMHINPYVIGHGIELSEWNPSTPSSNPYVLWNKNRSDSICDPGPMNALARHALHMRFISTFGKEDTNVHITGHQPHNTMIDMIKGAGVYLATTKETFGIGTLEAMACGIPVLGYRWGGTAELVQHKITGYLVEPGDITGLVEGLIYCMAHRSTLGEAARWAVQTHTWERVCGEVYSAWTCAAIPDPPGCTVVIPCYNKANTVSLAMRSVSHQSFPCNMIVVDDGSNDGISWDAIVKAKESLTPIGNKTIEIVSAEHGGVAHARNVGWQRSRTKYVCFLDADDQLDPEFIKSCIEPMERDSSLGITYTSLGTIQPNGSVGRSPWPGPFNYDYQVAGQNQIPTCCVMRRTLLDRSGGFRSEYAPKGAGSEDAELWLRSGALGFNALRADKRPLFLYRPGGQTSRPGYSEPNWRTIYPWTSDKLHPVASIATPSNKSHPARQYDRPAISILMEGTVGDSEDWKRIEGLTRTCDSLEAQTFRNWELISSSSHWSHLPFIRIGPPRARLRLRVRLGDWILSHTLEGLLMGAKEGTYIYDQGRVWRDNGI